MSITHQNQDSKNERMLARLLALLPEGWNTDSDSLSYSLTVGTAGVGVEELSYQTGGLNYVTQLTLTNVVLGAPTAGGSSAHGSLIYTFPAGVHVLVATYFDIGLTLGTTTTDTPDVGIGSTVGTGAVATLNLVAATAEDYITGQTWAVALTGLRTEVGPLGATAGVLTGISLNKRADLKTVYLNAADAWAAGVTGNLVANGEVSLMWTRLS